MKGCTSYYWEGRVQDTVQTHQASLSPAHSAVFSAFHWARSSLHGRLPIPQSPLVFPCPSVHSLGNLNCFLSLLCRANPQLTKLRTLIYISHPAAKKGFSALRLLKVIYNSSDITIFHCNLIPLSTQSPRDYFILSRPFPQNYWLVKRCSHILSQTLL